LVGEDYSSCWSLGGQLHKGLNSLVILGAWTIWNHHNRCVFDGVPPCLARALLLASEELQLCGLAGAKGIFLPFHPVVSVRCVCFFRLQSYPFSFTGPKEGDL
jgi:hypothetical protein